MTDITTAAAAFLILSGATAPAPVPRLVTPILPICCVPGWEPDCQLPQSPNPGSHIVVRWVGDQHPQPAHHLRVVRQPPFEDQPGLHEKGRGRHWHHPPRPHHHRHR